MLNQDCPGLEKASTTLSRLSSSSSSQALRASSSYSSETVISQGAILVNTNVQTRKDAISQVFHQIFIINRDAPTGYCTLSIICNGIENGGPAGCTVYLDRPPAAVIVPPSSSL